MKTLGLYLHIPFCRSKCLYCDFCSIPRATEEKMYAYTDALCGDLTKKAALCRDYTVDTVYLGGGTPTVLPTDALERILQTVLTHYRVSDDAEITAECNPATVGLDTLLRLRRAGLNRLSIGLQSAQKNELKALGRLHDFEAFRATFLAAREAGFENLSADVMFGIPHQSTESLLNTLEQLCALSPEHISSYGLGIEEGTPFGRMADRLPLPDEDTVCEMYRRGAEYLATNGYGQYEISNFAKAGYESRHNLKYWNCDEFLGFGPAAYSDFAGERFGYSRDVDAYIAGEEILFEREKPSPMERIHEYVMLRMRLGEGIVTSVFEERFDCSFDALFGSAIEPFVQKGLVLHSENGYRFTAEGMLLSNAVLSELLDFSGDAAKAKKNT